MDNQLSSLLENLASQDTQKYTDTMNSVIMMGDEALPWLIGSLEMTKYSSVWDKIILVTKKMVINILLMMQSRYFSVS